MMGYWYHFAIMFEALFILTTVDTGTRVARYVFDEIIKTANPRWKSKKIWAIIISGGIISFLWGYLVYNGDITTIWPMFGVANQLLATLALAVGTVYILKNSKRWQYGLITFIPAIFMFITTVVAGILNITGNYLPKRTAQGYINASLSAVMIVLVVAIFLESMRKIRRLKRKFEK
jgi:carbon starvation protein